MDDNLSAIFSALANPVRRDILARLSNGHASVNELAEPFDMSLPAISRHLKVLENAGLISRGRDAQFRPCAISPEPLRQVARWTEQYRAIWEQRFDRIENYLEQLEAKPDEN
uniref:ArsR/SmtB family transcription factor n=1 Tax=uncultured Altererythrobacter sp. TaxID=500840 RepID=UPI00260DEB1B|nr:metalloregulator ArsR/SmtB family transcription factor [uncultured Altererythrobacter sp.]